MFNFIFHIFYKGNHGDKNEDADGEVIIAMSILNVVLLTSSVFYIWCLVLATRKLNTLYSYYQQGVNPTQIIIFDLKKLLVISIIFICAVRIVTFGGVTAMNIRVHYSSDLSSHPQDNDQHTAVNLIHFLYSLFSHSSSSASSSDEDDSSNNPPQHWYDSSMTILFDLPNSFVVSTFVLLTIVWAECFLQSRFHTESMIQWKKRLLVGYIIFNSCLFFGQIVLYLLIFFPGTDKSVKIVKGVIYAGMVATNLGACLIALFAYFYLNLRFAGFPFKSNAAKASFTKISIVFFFWTMSRLMWTVANICVLTKKLELLHDADESIDAAVLLFFLHLFCEILPMMIMLDYSYIPIISFEQNAQLQQDRNSGYGDDRESIDNDILHFLMNDDGLQYRQEHEHDQYGNGNGSDSYSDEDNENGQDQDNNLGRLDNIQQQISELSWMSVKKRFSLFSTTIQEEDGEETEE